MDSHDIADGLSTVHVSDSPTESADRGERVVDCPECAYTETGEINEAPLICPECDGVVVLESHRH